MAALAPLERPEEVEEEGEAEDEAVLAGGVEVVDAVLDTGLSVLWYRS